MTPIEWPSRPEWTEAPLAQASLDSVLNEVRKCPFIRDLAPADRYLLLVTLVTDIVNEHRPLKGPILAQALSQLEASRLQLMARYREWFSELSLVRQFDLALAQRQTLRKLSLPSRAKRL